MRSEVDRIVSSFAQKLLAVLDDLAPKSPNEATLRQHVEPILREFCVKVGVDPEVRDEYVVAKGQIADAVFDRLVVEFKGRACFPLQALFRTPSPNSKAT